MSQDQFTEDNYPREVSELNENYRKYALADEESSKTWSTGRCS